MERKPRRKYHRSRLRQPTPETTSCASETPSTNRPMRTMRPRTRADGAMATPRPQRHTHRLPRLLTRQAMPCLWSAVQPQSRSQESTSHPALRQTTPPHSNRRAPLVSLRFFHDQLRVDRHPSALSHSQRFSEDDLGADRHPKPFRTHPIPIAIAAISLCGSSADAHPSARSIYLEKTPK